MEAADKHYKFINSKTGNVIFHFTVKGTLSDADARAELEKVKADVASKNAVFLDTIYKEEEKE